MEILKKISHDRLIIMVTHNPELAEQYSTRIIRMLDGELKADSAPLSEKELQLEEINNKAAQEHEEKSKKPSMSLGTSFSLSLKNLMTKKGRTALTSFAGSIGIIGIALILSISEGLSGYIDAVQEETLSSYPLTIQQEETDMSSLMETFMGINSTEVEHERDAVYTKPAIYEIINAMNNMETTENDLKSFKSYLEEEWHDENSETGLSDSISGIQYSYDLDMQVYTKNVDNEIIKSDTKELMTELTAEYMDVDMSSMMSMAEENGMASNSMNMMSMTSGGAMSMNLWQEMLPGKDGEPISDVLKKQYDIVYGEWPNEYDEIVLVLDENNELDDLTLYALGLESEEDVAKIIEAAIEQEEVAFSNNTWSYEEICDMEFRTVLNSDCFSYDKNTGLYTDLRESAAGLQYLYDNGISLKVTGIIRPAEDVEAPMLSGTIGYTSDLTEYVIENAKDSDAIQAQLEDSSTDILTGLPFQENTGNLSDEEKETELKSYLENLTEAGKAEAYVKIKGIPTQEQLDGAVSQAMSGMERADIEATMTQALTEQMGMSEADVKGYLENMDDTELEELFEQMVTEQVKAQFAQQAAEQMAVMPTAQLAAGLDAEMETYTAEQCSQYYDEVMVFSENTYDGNLTQMGYLDLESPSAINIYAATFEDKDVIEEAIEAYNEDKDEVSKIKYTDYVGIMMSSVSTIINAITYVLVAFVAISLVVSSIMIGVITLISVQERTKEIGILRAIGASKKNVSSMFNAETVIIGFTSGVLGVVLTCLLCIPVNAIIQNLTGIEGLRAHLPIGAAFVLILISVLLTLISGIIPSRSAAKKDPVVALRSE